MSAGPSERVPDLRVADPALSTSARIACTFDGTPLSALRGETVAAALAAAGMARMGTRKDGSARGAWCGMGVCQECLVTVDGIPSLRACMTAVADGMRVASQGYAPALPAGRQGMAPTPLTHRPRMLVLGAGPAGLSAARAAAMCGVAVTVIDERSSPGGQFFKQVAASHDVIDEAALDAQLRRGRSLIADVERLGATIVRGAAVWGAFGTDELATTVDGVQHVFRPDRLVLAAGAYERGVPVPGWTLPGYMTTGAAQTLLRAYRVKAGRRVLIAGNGPLNLQLAAELVAVGVDVVAVVEAAPRPSARHAAALLGAFVRAPSLMRDGLRYLARLRRANVPLIYRSAVVAARGADRVEACTLARIDASGAAISGTAVEYTVDTVCAGYGFLPSNELARALGCRHAVDDGTLRTNTDADGLTSVPGVYAIGDMTGLGGAHAAQHQGFITGCAVAQSLGAALPASVAAELALARQRLARSKAFQRALWNLFAAPVLRHQLAAADTVVCRCESVTRDTIEFALASGAITLGELKRRTRAGMGRCQGRYCESIMAAMMGTTATPMRDELASLAPRAPIKPLRIRDIV